MPKADRWQFNKNDLWVLLLFVLIGLWTFRTILIGIDDPFGSSLRKWEPWHSNLTAEDKDRNESFADDPTTQSYPWSVYAYENIQKGDFPLWNTRMFSGTPFVANRLTGLFDPLTFIPLAVFPPPWGLTVFYLVHYILAAWFMYLFLKCLGISRPAAVFGAVAYILQGAYIPWGGIIVADKTYFPMVLYYLQRTCDRKDRVGIVGFILAFFLISVNSYPLKTILTFYISVAWVLFTQGRGAVPAIKRLIGLGIMLVIAFLIGAMQHLPMFEFYNLSLRAQPEFAHELGSASFLERYDSPVSLLAIFFPWLWGDSLSGADGTLPPLVLAIYNHAYIGILAAFGFLFAPIVWRKSQYARFFIVFAILGLLFIAWHEFYMFIARIVPGLRISTVKPDFFALVSMVIIASFVLDHFIRNLETNEKFRFWVKRIYGWMLGAMIGMAVVAIIAKFAPMMFDPYGFSRYMIIFKGLIIVWIAGALIYLSASRRIKIGWAITGILILHLIGLGPYHEYGGLIPYHEYINPLIPKGRTGFLTPSIEFVMHKNEEEGPFRIFRNRSVALAPNMPMIYGLGEPGGFDSFVSADYAHFFRTVDPPKFEGDYVMSRNSRTLDLPSEYEHYYQPFWDFLGIRYLMSTDPMPSLPKPPWVYVWPTIEEIPELIGGIEGKDEDEIRSEIELFIYENPEWCPRWFLVERIIPVETIEDGYEMAQAFDPHREAVVVGIEHIDIPPILLESLPEEEESVGNISLESYGADELRLNVDCTQDCFLVFSDTYFPGWRAWVDDEEVEVYRTDAIIKGIVVPSGNHEVRFLYDPPLYKIGWLMAIVGLVLIPFVIRPVRLLYSRRDKSGIDTEYEVK